MPAFHNRLIPNSTVERMLLTLYFGLLCAMRCVYQRLRYGNMYIQDDAYYYFIVARNIAYHGLSTFDGQTLTNGYHPLWMALLVLQYSLFGDSLYVTLAMEILLFTGALYLFLATFDGKDFIIYILFGALLFRLMSLIALNGMEVSLWTFCFALLLYLCRKTGLRDHARGAVLLGLSAAACIAARIDSVVFVLPFLFLALPSLRTRLLAFAPVALLGVTYAGANQIMFGVAFPISGAVKSLGGFQLNHALIAQYARMASNPLHVLTSQFWLMPTSFLAAPVLLLFAPRNSTARLLLLSYCIGFIFYAVKLLFFSSWRIWEWYCFPLIIFLMGVFCLAEPVLDRFAGGRSPIWRKSANLALFLALLAGLLVFPVLCMTAVRGPNKLDFAPINRLAVAEFGRVLNGDRVAMGDRAGSFAAAYDGPLTQIEGLVNDKEYLGVLASHGDVQTLLCRRGVKYLLSYASDLGDYKEYDVPVIRSYLSGFHAPVVHVTHAQEVGRVHDAKLFDNSAVDEGDNYLYLWHMDCPATGTSSGSGSSTAAARVAARPPSP